jgi:large exoprotein involved in heme utilization and adhesion
LLLTTPRSIISTSAINSFGGDITLQIPHLLYLADGEITTSVGSGIGKGGNITIAEPEFLVLEQGQINAQAEQGEGGNISIIAKNFIQSPDSLISASSKLGIDGQVNVESPELNLDQFVVILPGNYLETTGFNDPCHFRDLGEMSSFQARAYREGGAVSPEWFLD